MKQHSRILPTGRLSPRPASGSKIGKVEKITRGRGPWRRDISERISHFSGRKARCRSVAVVPPARAGGGVDDQGESARRGVGGGRLLRVAAASFTDTPNSCLCLLLHWAGFR